MANTPDLYEVPYNIGTSSIVHSVQAARKSVLEAAVKEIHAQITQRNQLTQRVLQNIQEELLQQESELFAFKPMHEGWFSLDREKINEIEQAIANLKRQGRSVITENWQDVAELRKELREFKIELATLERKQGLLEGLLDNAAHPPEDHPGASTEAPGDTRQGN